jgi:hypothetical protein
MAPSCCTPLQAIKEGRSQFNFLGQDIRLIPSCAICVTMNPGYAGERPSLGTPWHSACRWRQSTQQSLCCSHTT